MIEAGVEELVPVVGTRPACRALGVAPATIYRRRRPPEPRERKPRQRPVHALTEAERGQVLEVLHSERFVDCSPAVVWASLLDEGRTVRTADLSSEPTASEGTMLGKSRFLDALTLVTAVAAIAVAGKSLFMDASPTATRVSPASRDIPTWRELAAEGRRIGPTNALMTIVEWVDYECPACRAFHPHSSAVLRKYPKEVALVIRHYPLPIHASAYDAARAAECAAAYGDFATFHARLLEGAQLDRNAFVAYATEAGVADASAFDACLNATAPVERIERDIVSAQDVGAQGTPTVIVNGLMLSSWVDSLTLEGTLIGLRRENRGGSR